MAAQNEKMRLKARTGQVSVSVWAAAWLALCLAYQLAQRGDGTVGLLGSAGAVLAGAVVLVLGSGRTGVGTPHRGLLGLAGVGFVAALLATPFFGGRLTSNPAWPHDEFRLAGAVLAMSGFGAVLRAIDDLDRPRVIHVAAAGLRWGIAVVVASVATYLLGQLLIRNLGGPWWLGWYAGASLGGAIGGLVAHGWGPQSSRT